MNYSHEIIVELPINEFIRKFDSIENMKHWQRGLVSVEHISGNPGNLGAKMKLGYKMAGRTMELMETITHSDFPHEFHATYHTKGVHNIQENYFESISEKQTKWTSKSEFVPLNFMMRSMMWLMPKTFKKQSYKYMVDFKNFAEKGISVANEKA